MNQIRPRVNLEDPAIKIRLRGGITVKSRIPINNIDDLRTVYTPGVAKACEAIVKYPEIAWTHTGICDRVAIVTNGTAVLGLGDIGTVAGLPVMEGKAAIFAEFVNISAIPILVETKNTQKIIEVIKLIAPTFGAIQLEDIAAPACFEIEEALISLLNIPVLHDDQHGTATVTLAALITALKYTGKKREDATALILGAGAAGIAIAKILHGYGIKDIVVFDSAGAIYKGRTEKMNPYKEALNDFTNKENFQGTLPDGFKNKDIFIGVARPNMVNKNMIASMNKNAIAFPMSNPVGEITVEEALQAGAAVAADGRMINNALVYPGLFRGALDAKAKTITTKMQIAAASKAAAITPDGELLPDMIDRNVHKQIAKAVKIAAES
jgi:malate dehydrogenase (oxaloacetate-decarboxylating)